MTITEQTEEQRALAELEQALLMGNIEAMRKARRKLQRIRRKKGNLDT